MSCVQWEEQIYRYFDHRLSSEEELALLTHIQQCTNCAELFSEIKEINDLLQEEAALVDVPEDFSSRVMAALPDAPWKAKDKEEERASSVVVPFPQKAKNGKRFTRWGTAVAAAVLVAAVGVSQLSGEVEGPSVPGGISVVDNQKTPVDEPPVVEPPANTTQEPGPSVTGQPNENTVSPSGNDGQQPRKVENTASPNTTVTKPVAGSGEVVLPQVAAGKEKTGIFSLLLLAASEDADALNPIVVDGNTVEYFVRSAYGTSKWQSKVSTSESPVLLEDKVKLGAAQGVNNVAKAEWLTDTAYTEAVSPLGDITLLNTSDKDGGLWKITNSEDKEPKLLYQASGGNILSWSPDGTKAVYTDSNGNLYVVYPTEEVVMLVFEGNVSSVAWGADSKMIAFSATGSGSAYSAVYSANLP